jgi:uncharacterized protein YndB with AHSA1/START domain
MTAASPATADRTRVERRSDRELVVTRTFAAPARLVYRAWTEPELLKRWWTPRSRGVVLHECTASVRVGGTYRYVFGKVDQPAMAFSGTYTEVVPDVRVVCTQLFEPIPQAGEAIVTATFTEAHGATTLVLHQLFPSKQALDGAVASGMEHGMRETFDQLDALVTGPQ